MAEDKEWKEVLESLEQALGGMEQPSLGLRNFHLILRMGSPQGMGRSGRGSK